MIKTIPIQDKSDVLCSICKKRPATKLCDFPIGRSRYVGHPPRHLMEQAKRSDVAWKEVCMSWTITCDRPLCSECAISMSDEIDFCPSHIQDMQIKRALKKQGK